MFPLEGGGEGGGGQVDGDNPGNSCRRGDLPRGARRVRPKPDLLPALPLLLLPVCS